MRINLEVTLEQDNLVLSADHTIRLSERTDVIRALSVVKFLLSRINKSDPESGFVLLNREDAETMTSFADTFTDGEDPEENPMAADVMRIVKGWTF